MLYLMHICTLILNNKIVIRSNITGCNFYPKFTSGWACHTHLSIYIFHIFIPDQVFFANRKAITNEITVMISERIVPRPIPWPISFIFNLPDPYVLTKL